MYRESLSSYLYRLLFANYSMSLSGFGQLYDLSFEHMNWGAFSETEFGILAQLTGLSPDVLEEMGINRWIESGTITERDVLKSKVKFCPVCIQQTSHHQIHWFVRSVSMCTQHAVLLEQHCQWCGRSVSMRDLIIGMCFYCEFDLRQTTVKPFPRRSLMLKAQIDLCDRLWGLKGKIVLEHLSFSAYMELARWSFHLLQGMPSFVDPTDVTIEPFYIKSGGMDNFKSAVTLGNVFWMYQTRQNFWRVLERFTHKPSDIRYEQKRQYEQVFLSLNLRQLKEWYDSFWLKMLDHGMIRSDFSVFKTSPTLLQNREFASKQDLRDDWHVTPNHLSNLKQHAQLNVNSVRRGKTMRYLVPTHTLRRMLAEENAYVTRKEAASQLGIHPNSIPKLVKAGYLKEQSSPRGVSLITRESILELLRNCRGKFDTDVRGTLFHNAMAKYSSKGLTLVALITWIIERRVITWTTENQGCLKDLLLDQKQLLICLEELKEKRQVQQGYTVEDVRLILQVADRTVKDMVKQKIIYPTACNVGPDGRRHYMFDKRFIDDFANTHMRIPQAAKVYSIPEHRLRKWVREGKLSNRTPRITRRPLLRTDEIEKLLANHEHI